MKVLSSPRGQEKEVEVRCRAGGRGLAGWRQGVSNVGWISVNVSCFSPRSLYALMREH